MNISLDTLPLDTISLYLMVITYIVAGVYHFVNPEFYLSMMPKFVPYHSQVVKISGVIELILAVMLIPEVTRSLAAWLIIVLLIVVFPANIQMVINFRRRQHPNLWISIARLPFQLGFIWWAWTFTK